MKLIVRCECGQGIQVEQQASPRSVQCPTCGKVLTVAGAGAPWPYPCATPAPPASGKATAALVFGVLSFVPGLGLIFGPIAIALGITVLVRKLTGRGFGIAGLACGAAGLLVVQVVLGLYIFAVVMLFRTVGASMATMAPPTAVPGVAALPALDDEEIATALEPDFPPRRDPQGAARALTEARRFYEVREVAPGSRYRCVEMYARHLAARQTADFAEPRDAAAYKIVREELVEEVTRQYRLVEKLLRSERYLQGRAACERLKQMVPDPSNRIHVLAVMGAQSGPVPSRIEELPVTGAATAPAPQPPEAP